MIKIIKNTGDTEQFVLISVPGIILSVILLTLSEMRPHKKRIPENVHTGCLYPVHHAVSDTSFLMHEGCQIDPRGSKLFHDCSHIFICIVVGAVFTDSGIQKIIVGSVHMRLPVGLLWL